MSTSSSSQAEVMGKNFPTRESTTEAASIVAPTDGAVLVGSTPVVATTTTLPSTMVILFPAVVPINQQGAAAAA